MNSTVLLFLAQAPAPAAPSAGELVVPILCMGLIMYMLFVVPMKRQKELRAKIAALKTGDKVVTNSGIHGIVANIKDGPTLSLKIAENVKIEVDKTAIATVASSDKGDKEKAVAKS